MTDSPLPALRGGQGFRARPTATAAILGIGLPLVLILVVLATLDVGGQTAVWENGHWTLTAAMGLALAVIGARWADGAERQVRTLGVVAVGLYLAGQLAWDAQIALGIYPTPAPSDILFLGMVLPFLSALGVAIRTHGSRAELRTFLLDAAVVTAAIVAVVFFAFAEVAAGAGGLGVVLLLYPTFYFGLAGATIVGALATRSPLAPRGSYLIALGMVLIASDWVWYIGRAIDEQPTAGGLPNILASIGCVLIGLGVATWRTATSASRSLDRVASRIQTLLPIGAIAVAAAILMEPREELNLVAVAAGAAIVVAMIRQTFVLSDQTAFLESERKASERERELREGAQVALAAREASEARYRSLVDVFNRLGERMTFAADEGDMFTAAAAALGQLVPAPAGNILSINPSVDRLCVALAWGDGALALDSAVEVESPDRCYGIRRGTTFSVDDATEPWTSACPAYPMADGSSLCVPMVAAGNVIGVIHVARPGSKAFTKDDRGQASRIAEQVALAVANTRLLHAMEGLALTDGLTGLHNARFFDPFLDRELAQSQRDETPIGIIAIDLDHFKQFNDTYGHPAGDEALRAFARGCLGALRDADTMARIGGEEFCVAVRGADLEATTAIAEELRATVEHLVVEIGPGRFARLTASFGVADSVDHGVDRKRLLRAADHALYAAKRQGRNVVVAERRTKAERPVPRPVARRAGGAGSG